MSFNLCPRPRAIARGVTRDAAGLACERYVREWLSERKSTPPYRDAMRHAGVVRVRDRLEGEIGSGVSAAESGGSGVLEHGRFLTMYRNKLQPSIVPRACLARPAERQGTEATRAANKLAQWGCDRVRPRKSPDDSKPETGVPLQARRSALARKFRLV